VARSRSGNSAPEKVKLPLRPTLERGLEVGAVLEGFKAAFAVSHITQNEDGARWKISTFERLLVGEFFVLARTVVSDVQRNLLHQLFSEEPILKISEDLDYRG
jgi:hypothetical protein